MYRNKPGSSDAEIADNSTALAATLAFLGVNGIRLTLTNDDAYTLIVDVAAGRLDDAGTIAGALQSGSAPR